jgi:hypothetical protein
VVEELRATLSLAMGLDLIDQVRSRLQLKRNKLEFKTEEMLQSFKLDA